MEDGFSSDDEIFWGPYTLREAKRDLKNYKPKQPSMRYTICPSFSMKPKQNSPTVPSPSPSEYGTPRDSTNNDSNNFEFLKEVTNAINQPSPMASFHTAVDQTSLLECTFLKKVATNLTNKSNLINNQTDNSLNCPTRSSKNILDVSSNKELDKAHNEMTENKVDSPLKSCPNSPKNKKIFIEKNCPEIKVHSPLRNHSNSPKNNNFFFEKVETENELDSPVISCLNSSRNNYNLFEKFELSPRTGLKYNIFKSPITNDTFLERVAENKTFNLDTIQQTLVENTVILSDEECEQNVPCNSLHLSQDSLNLVNVKREKISLNQQKILNESVIEISDEDIDSLSLSMEKSNCYDVMSDSIKDMQCQPNDSLVIVNYDASDSDTDKDYRVKEGISVHDQQESDADYTDENCQKLKHDKELNYFDSDLQQESTNEDINADDLQKDSSESEPNKPNVEFLHPRVGNRYSYKSAHSCSRQEHHNNTAQTSVYSIASQESGVYPLNSTGESSQISETNPNRQGSPAESTGDFGYISKTDDKNQESEITCPERSQESREENISKINEFKEKIALSNATELVKSADSDTSKFDDTLEELNRFLATGHLDDSFHSKESLNPPLNRNPTQNLSITPGKVRSIPVFKSESKTLQPQTKKNPFNSVGPQQKYFDFGKNPKPPAINRKNLFEFKMPITPVKVTPNKNLKPKNPQYKNIQSPIGVYIKNSPRYAPLINVKPKEISNIPLFKHQPTNLKSKENVTPNTLTHELPPVVYKPSKTQQNSTKIDVKLPPSIKKICPEPFVIRHEAKYCGKTDVESKLAVNENLTLNSTGESSFLGPDISIWTTKQAFKK